MPRCLAPLLLLLVIRSALAQGTGEAQKPVEPGPRMLHGYLLAEAQKQFDARRKVLAAIKTPEEVKNRQQDLRTRFIDALGGFPERTPLNARVVEKMDGDECTIEKVIFESRPDHHVTALLYLPKGKPPFPGVLLP